MVTYYIWQNANPELRGHLRTANEARSATIYAAWRAVAAPLRRLSEGLSRALREGNIRRTLSGLSDRTLRDIGLSRSEIGSVAQAIATNPLEAGVTIADLRRTGSGALAGREVVAAPRTRAVQRRGEPARQAALAAHRRLEAA